MRSQLDLFLGVLQTKQSADELIVLLFQLEVFDLKQPVLVVAVKEFLLEMKGPGLCSVLAKVVSLTWW